MGHQGEIKERADRLVEDGLLLLREAKSSEMLKTIGETWQEALELYRSIGDEDKVKEIEQLFNSLSKKILKHSTKESRTKAAQEIPLPKFASQSQHQTKRGLGYWGVFLKVGALGFGGPMAIMGLLQDELVSRKKILTNKDFLEAAVLGDILPGPVTMDIVTYTGFKLYRWIGALIYTTLFILPSFILMIILARAYSEYNSIPLIKSILHCLGAAVVGIIVYVGLKLLKSEIRTFFGTGLLVWAFASYLIFNLNMVLVVTLTGVVGMLLVHMDPSVLNEEYRT